MLLESDVFHELTAEVENLNAEIEPCVFDDLEDVAFYLSQLLVSTLPGGVEIDPYAQEDFFQSVQESFWVGGDVAWAYAAFRFWYKGYPYQLELEMCWDTESFGL